MSEEATEAPVEAPKAPARKTAASPRKRAAAKPTATRKPRAAKKPDYRPGLAPYIQLPSQVLLGIGLASNNTTLLADGYAIAQHGPGVIEALNDLGNNVPAVGAVLEKMTKAGPYTGIAMAVVPLIAQLVANHVPSLAGTMAVTGAQNPKALAEAAKAELGSQMGALLNGENE